MSQDKYLGTARVVVINKDAILSNGSRAAADYINDSAGDFWADVYLQVQFNTAIPTIGDKIADLWILPGDGEATELFPHGGDGTVGADEDPQAVLKVGSFETRAPSLTVNEILGLAGVKLHPDGNRFVLKNTSLQEFDLTWELRARPYRTQNVA